MAVKVAATEAQTPALTRAIAQWVTEVSPANISKARLFRAKVAVLDFLGCVYAASALPEAQTAFTLARPGLFSVPGTDERVDLPSAVLAWGTLGALLQWHDGYGRGGNHPSSSVLPALLAGIPSTAWEKIAIPVVVGYEVANRLSSITHPHQTLIGSAPTSTMGAIGAAAALCRWEGLDADTTTRALGLAGFWAPVALFEGLRFRGNGVPLHGGLAARAGWEAVQAAKAGLEASEYLLEGRDGPGLLDLMGGPNHPKEAINPGTWQGESLDQVYLKPFPGCRHVHPAVEAALGLRNRLPAESSRWSTIAIETYAVALSFHRTPRVGAELYDCLMSLPWCVALTLLYGAPDLATVTTNRAQANLLDLSSRVKFSLDQVHQSSYPSSLGATIRITLDDGRTLEQVAVLRYADTAQTFSPAGPFGPVLDRQGVIQKFLRLSASLGPDSFRQDLAERILGSP